MKRKVVFLDRDGCLIEDKIYLNDPDQIHYLPGGFEALKRLRDHGFDFIIVTNQSGIARGLVDPENLKEVHRRIRHEFAIRGVDILAFYYAPYLPTTDHYYRKPQPGMIMEGAMNYNVDLKQSWMVGDRMTDVEAGHRAGCRTVMIRGTEVPEDSEFSLPEAFVNNLNEMADFIIQASSAKEKVTCIKN